MDFYQFIVWLFAIAAVMIACIAPLFIIYMCLRFAGRMLLSILGLRKKR